MNILDYFEPVVYRKQVNAIMPFTDSLACQIQTEVKTDIELYDVVIIGIPDATNSPYNLSCALAPDIVRSQFHNLRRTERELSILDLGNVKGQTVNDKYFAVRETVSELIRKDVIVFFIGGSQDFLMPVIESFKKNDTCVSIIDYKVDYSSEQGDYSSDSFLSGLKDAAEVKLNIIGAQNYYIGNTHKEFIEEQNGNLVRLNEVKGNKINFIEPYLRDSDIVSFDIGAIEDSVISYHKALNVNGFTALEACQILWYSGWSSEMKVCGISEYAPELNNTENTVLIAQMLWHFLEGVSYKVVDIPSKSENNCKIFIVHLQDYGIDLRFYKNKATNRWWVEVPSYQKKKIIACCEEHYNEAKKGELTAYLWSYFQFNLKK